MTADRDLGRRLADLFADEAPRLAPEWVLPSALTTIESTRQRRGLLAPWRFTQMPMYARLGAAAAALVAVVAVAVWQLNSSGVGHPTSTPMPSPSTTSVPQLPASYTVPPLTQTFTSTIYGVSLSYPAGWSSLVGNTPWPTGPAYSEPQGDLLYDPTRENLFLKVASQPLGTSSFEQWSATVFAGRECTGSNTPVTVDGAQGVIDSSCYAALVPSSGRGYLIAAHWNSDIAELRSIDWAGWLRDVLATVQLQPEKAVDTK